MSREDIYREMREALGEVPSFFESIPDGSLELEWELFKRVQMEPGPIPNKYRELIGVAVAAARGCPYCSFYHAEVAKLNGATDEEIEGAVHYAKSSMGWSTYLHGMQTPLEGFKGQVRRICQHVRQGQLAGVR